MHKYKTILGNKNTYLQAKCSHIESNLINFINNWKRRQDIMILSSADDTVDMFM